MQTGQIGGNRGGGGGGAYCVALRQSGYVVAREKKKTIFYICALRKIDRFWRGPRNPHAELAAVDAAEVRFCAISNTNKFQFKHISRCAIAIIGHRNKQMRFARYYD